MSIRQLVQLEHACFQTKETLLRKQTLKVVDFNNDLKKQVVDLIDTLMYHKIAIGLAAPQIGIQARFCAINLKQDDSVTLVLINPEILSTSGKKDRKKESCMSLPHYRGAVERRDKVHIKYQNENGEHKNLEANGFFARVICHEIDHLDGMLYLDRMENPNTLEPVTFF
jgi:peptide deformylase